MKIKSDGATLNGFLDRGSHLHGDLTFEETFRIDGKFEGKIRAKERIDLLPSARVFAELASPIVKIEEGARFEGSCQMGGEAASNVVGLQHRK